MNDTAPTPTNRTKTGRPGEDRVRWHALDAEDALRRLASGPDGLAPPEIARRLERHGYNRLPATKPRGLLRRLVAQFDNLLIYVLLGSAAITGALGHVVDTAVILAVVAINAAVGVVQEGRAERALDAIRNMLSPQASVMREGRRLTVAADTLVPGDIVLLEPGDRVPADMRLIRSRNLRIQEAALTGESVPVEKSPAAVAGDAPVADRSSMAFSGTLVAAGQASGVVVDTGAETELGRIGALVQTVQTLTTPLLRQMNVFARWLTGAILAVAMAVFAVGTVVHDFTAMEAFMAVVGMTVAAIPEGLPAVLTITLAIGVQRMAARHAIIRRLPAVEALGCVSIICSDKTGTLTRNEMTVRAAVTWGGRYEVTGEGYEPRGGFRLDGSEAIASEHPLLLALARAGLLCNDATLRHADGQWAVDGDPMEGALIALAVKAGHDAVLVRKQLPRTDEIPFDAEHRFMATLHHSHEDGAFACLKGAPEVVLERCRQQAGPNGPTPLDDAYWHRQITSLTTAGQRVIAVGTKPMARDRRDLKFSDVDEGFILLGLLGLIDPPRDEAIRAVGECQSAGIRVKMITGDHAVTALAIAGQLGLQNHRVVATGRQLDGLDDEAFLRTASDVDVFARTTPAHKLRLIEALQAEGAVVAMTGDGVNDAPALKRADIGIAMGLKGTEAAKEAAEMVLADDNFASIVAAVREGRAVYDNIKKVIAWTLPTNGGESLTVILALLLGLALPMTPVQILWINMVTATTLGLVLAFEPVEDDAMRRPPRRAAEPLLSGFLAWRILLVSLLFVAGAFGVFAWAMRRGLPIAEAHTIVVNTIVVMEIFYLFSVRYLRLTSLTWRGLLGTPAVLIGVAAVTVLQLAFTYAPAMNDLFGTRPVSFQDGVLIVGVGVALLAVLEGEKLIRRRLGWNSTG